MAIATPPPTAPPVWTTSTPAWRGPVIAGALGGAATLLVTIGDPNTTHVPLCPFKALTPGHWDCAFCGSLRATHSLTHGDLAGALDHNIVFTLVAPFLVAAWVIWLLRALGHPVLPRLQLPRWAFLAGVAFLVAFTIVRTLPAFSYLAST